MDRIIVLDFGGQYCHLISRRIRDLGVYSEVLPCNTLPERIRKIEGISGIVLSGGASSVYDNDSPRCDCGILRLGIPVLGICYGHQLIAYMSNGFVMPAESGEYGLTEMQVKRHGRLLDGLSDKESVWMNHRDIVQHLGGDFSVSASTKTSAIAAFENPDDRLYGVQFHPEVSHTACGSMVLENFVFGICKTGKGWSDDAIIEEIEEEIKAELGGKKAIIGLSGGVDSSTAAALISKAIGSGLTAVYVDTGLMRHKETEFIEKVFSGYGLNLVVAKEADRFFAALKGITEPEEKRRVIGKTFVDVFDKAALRVGAETLVQGTIYSDRIESGITAHSSKIKSHHNVGGLPEDMRLKVYEPLRNLYKDEVRRIAARIGLPDEIITRHIFPGPGLAVRIIGEVTPEKAETIRSAGFIVEDELKKAGLYNDVWMGFAVLLPIKSVGIQGDSRTYKYPVAVRIIESKDAMTANFAKVPYDLLERVSTRITNEIPLVNRVVYDISNKPPATMEWE